MDACAVCKKRGRGWSCRARARTELEISGVHKINIATNPSLGLARCANVRYTLAGDATAVLSLLLQLGETGECLLELLSAQGVGG